MRLTLTAAALAAVLAVLPLTEAHAEPPPHCVTDRVCRFYGRGGDIAEWQAAADRAILTATLYGHAIIVPRNKPCWSACVLAVGRLLDRGIKVQVDPRADVDFRHHDDKTFTAWLAKQPMPGWLRDRALKKGRAN